MLSDSMLRIIESKSGIKRSKNTVQRTKSVLWDWSNADVFGWAWKQHWNLGPRGDTVLDYDDDAATNHG